MMQPLKNCSALILSAGVSSRMGFPKAFLKWDEHTFFLEKIINEYTSFLCREIIVVVNKLLMDYYVDKKAGFLAKVKIIVNDFPELPRFLSVRMGFQNVTSGFCFLQNSDNPFTDQELLTKLYADRKSDGYVSPVYLGKRGHPVLLGSNMFHEILNTQDNSVVLSDILKKYSRFEVESKTDKILCNINTPEEYDKYFKI